MNTFAPMPNPAALMAQYQAGQKAQTPPPVPPQAPPVAPTNAPLSPQMPAADTIVPPMPAPVQVGTPAQAQQPSVLETIWNQLKQQRGNQPVPSWAQNFGNLTDQGGTGGTPA